MSGVGFASAPYSRDDGDHPAVKLMVIDQHSTEVTYGFPTYSSQIGPSVLSWVLTQNIDRGLTFSANSTKGRQLGDVPPRDPTYPCYNDESRFGRGCRSGTRLESPRSICPTCRVRFYGIMLTMC